MAAVGEERLPDRPQQDPARPTRSRSPQPPVLQPADRERRHDRLLPDRPASVHGPDPARRPDPLWGYNGPGPRADDPGDRGRGGRRPPGQPAARRRTHARLHPVDLHPPARLARRCRSSTATPATSPQPGQCKDYDTRTPGRRGRSGTTTTACTTPRRTSTWASPRSTTSPTRRGGAAAPAGRLRRAADPQRRRCSPATAQLLWDDDGHSGVFGDVILVNGRPWPIDAGRAAQVPLPRCSTPRSPAATGWQLATGGRSSSSPPTAG